jgi:Zn-dependent M28 family amino/carboxypeptidase
MGYVKGTEYPDSFIFLTAHYDHLGEMGKGTYFPGANDNASGIAILIDMARYFANSKIKPRYSIGFIAFAGEEAGLVGSKYYTDYPVTPLKNISFLMNMDLMANGQTGMMVVNGSVFPKEYGKLVHINDSAHYLYAIDKRGKAANSDHYWFSEKGVKAFFFYLLGKYPYYHDIYDTSDKPTMAGYDGAFRLIRDFIVSYGQ